MQSDQSELINYFPDVPSHFCFDKNEFVGDHFEVDLFVNKHQNNMPLEQLREDLSIYLRTLRLSLIDLINKDYEEFLNLSSSFIGIDANIKNLVYPIKCIKNQVQKISDEIQITLSSFNENLHYLKSIKKKKKALIFILNAAQQINKIEEIIKEKGLNEDELERISFQVYEIHNKMQLLDLDPSFFNNEFKEKVIQLLDKVNDHLEEIFLKKYEFHNNKDVEIILQIYVLNEQLDIFLKNVVKKLFFKKLNDYICYVNVDKYGIVTFYDNLLDLIKENIKLFQIINLEGIDVLNNVLSLLCNMITESLILNASSLFLAGNPEVFILNYKETIKFFKNFFSFTNPIKSFDMDASFIKLKKKFNCEIYFHIRFQQVSNILLKSIEEPILFQNKLTNNYQSLFKIKIISVILDLVKYIWSDEIYIDTLFCDFWRLTLQLISRYTIFLQNFNLTMLNKNNLIDNIELDILVLISLINESNSFLDFIHKIYFSHIKPKIPDFCNEIDLSCCLDDSLEVLKQSGLPYIQKLTQKVVCEQSFIILTQIKEIPRLYRKTNRDIPSKASNYIINCTNLLKQLKIIFKFSKVLIQNILNEVTSNFYKLTNEVLDSVQKMEESLRRLKKVQNSHTENLKNIDKKVNIKSDEDKIRLQLKIDVIFYNETIINIFEISEKIQNFEDLYNLIKFIEN